MIFSTLEEILDLYAKWGNRKYAEDISQTEHAVQCARLAIKDNAPSHLIVAALLHDVGHLIELAQQDGVEDHSTDLQHEITGSQSLAKIFPASVLAPISLHVEAKRWLCAKEHGYMSSLSRASLNSLILQGGPMNEDETQHFESIAGSSDAITLRRWDDTGKDELTGGDIEEFSNMLRLHWAP